MNLNIEMNDELYNILVKITERYEMPINKYIIESIIEKIEYENSLDLRKYR